MLTKLAGGTAVSIGEGSGQYLLALAERFPEIFFLGFDLDANRIAVANELRRAIRVDNAGFAVADACALPLPDASADFVYARNMLHIVPDKAGLLSEISRMSRGPVSLSAIRNVNIAWVVFRVLALANALLGRCSYREFMTPHWATEDWLRQIGAYRGMLWYRAMVRRVFPEARLRLRRLCSAIDFDTEPKRANRKPPRA
jgi:ubiquinone/menaquinone biosynthesis C-methylase UbiE